jgi:hypothetical protein
MLQDVRKRRRMSEQASKLSGLVAALLNGWINTDFALRMRHGTGSRTITYKSNGDGEMGRKVTAILC